MESNWTSWLLVGAGLMLLIVLKRIDLLAFIAPLSLFISWFLARKQPNAAA